MKTKTIHGAIPITIQDVSGEITARILKAEAKKYNCPMAVCKGGNAELFGDQQMIPHMINDIKESFKGGK